MNSNYKREELASLAKEAINKGAVLATANFFFGDRNTKYQELCDVIIKLHKLAQEHD